MDTKPHWDVDGIPWCTYEDCPSYDGKRCSATGFRPSNICEPAVREMAELLHKKHNDWWTCHKCSQDNRNYDVQCVECGSMPNKEMP